MEACAEMINEAKSAVVGVREAFKVQPVCPMSADADLAQRGRLAGDAGFVV